MGKTSENGVSTISTSESTLPSAFADFKRLNPRIYYRSPQTTLRSSEAQNDPQLILLMSWAGASLRHVAKYVAAYTQMFPQSTLIVIRTGFPEMVHRTRTAQYAELQPVIDAILAAAERGNGRHRVLLHTLSNAGVHTAWYLAVAYASRLKASGSTTAPLPVSLVVMDSAPGSVSLSLGIRAIVITVVKSRIARLLLYPVVAVLLSIFAALSTLFRIKSVIQELREGMNNPALIPREAKRICLYSERDELIPVEAVESHIREAESKGYQVEKVNFGKSSGHVSHARVDAGRYWGVIRRAWEETRG